MNNNVCVGVCVKRKVRGTLYKLNLIVNCIYIFLYVHPYNKRIKTCVKFKSFIYSHITERERSNILCIFNNL